MFQMMTNDRKIEEFLDIQSCVNEMIANGWRCRVVMFHEGDCTYQKKIIFDDLGNVKIGRKIIVS